MGLFSRFLMVIRVKSSAALRKAENPVETLEYVDDQQREMLRRLKQGIIEVSISKRQLEQHVQALQDRIPQLERQAAEAMGAEREDLARIALERKQTARTELDRLTQQVDDVEQEKQRLIGAEQRLSARIEEFKTRRRTLSARYSAAEAQVTVKEALTGVSGEFADLSVALGRAEEKIEYMIARASAVDELIDGGGITSVTSSSVDVVERELAEIAGKRIVESELEALQAAPIRDEARNGKLN